MLIQVSLLSLMLEYFLLETFFVQWNGCVLSFILYAFAGVVLKCCRAAALKVNKCVE